MCQQNHKREVEDLLVFTCCLTAQLAAVPLSFEEATDIFTRFLSIAPFLFSLFPRCLPPPTATTSILLHTLLRFLFSCCANWLIFLCRPSPPACRSRGTIRMHK